MSYTYLQQQAKQYIIDYINRYIPNDCVLENINLVPCGLSIILNVHGQYVSSSLGQLHSIISIPEYRFSYMMVCLLLPIFRIYGLDISIEELNENNINDRIFNVCNQIIPIYGKNNMKAFDVTINIYNLVTVGFLKMCGSMIVGSSLLLLTDPIQCINKMTVNNSSVVNIPRSIEAKIWDMLNKYFLLGVYFDDNYLIRDVFGIIVSKLLMVH